MMRLTSFALLLSAMAVGVSGLGTDYIDEAPATVYEATEMSPQNMDFDAANNMFVAHSGWYNDQLIHYYKFRIFAPDTYPGVVMMDGTSSDVPLQKIYMVTTTGDFDGVVGIPIIEYHHADGTNYSDFMSVTFVDAPTDYVADMYKSVGDLADATMTDSGIVLNIPLVPTGATLQHPITMGTDKAPILPTPVYYRGVEVMTYVFEVTDESAAAFFASTRTDPGAEIARQSSTPATEYGIPVVPTFATTFSVSAIPIWHVNQFSNGVVAGENGGGPNPAGMRNVINLDRSDAGYSPLWQIYWATQLPVNCMADEFSNAAQGTTDNGIEFFTAPMYVNCPDIGPIGADNTMKAEMFERMILLGDMGGGSMNMKMSYTLIGSHPMLIMMGGKTVNFMSDMGDMIGTTTTNMMGGYEYTIPAADIPEGTGTVMVMLEDGTEIRSVIVSSATADGGGDMTTPSGAATSATRAVSFLVVAAAAFVSL